MKYTILYPDLFQAVFPAPAGLFPVVLLHNLMQNDSSFGETVNNWSLTSCLLHWVTSGWSNTIKSWRTFFSSALVWTIPSHLYRLGPYTDVTWERLQKARKVTLLKQAIGKPIAVEAEPTDTKATIVWPVIGVIGNAVVSYVLLGFFFFPQPTGPRLTWWIWRS